MRCGVAPEQLALIYKLTNILDFSNFADIIRFYENDHLKYKIANSK